VKGEATAPEVTVRRAPRDMWRLFRAHHYKTQARSSAPADCSVLALHARPFRQRAVDRTSKLLPGRDT